LVISVYFPVPGWASFLEFWGVSSYYFVEYISYVFGLHLFSSSDAHDLQDWFLDGITDIIVQHILY
jgi:hypothetical protein